MSSSNSGARFATIFDSLPRDAQQKLVDQQLIPLLSSVPKSKLRKALRAASRLQKRHENIPELDLRDKKLEINNMLRELNKDTKRAYVMDSSNRVELLNEIVDSLAAWLSDVWAVVYEHRVNFSEAHSCLLFVSVTLDRLENVRMGCKCALDSLYIPVTIRNRKGRVVKRFNVNGAAHLEDVTLFIWRDMLLSMLAYGSQQHKDMIPKMLCDIEEAMGWKAVVRLMYSKGSDDKHHKQSDNENDWEDVESGDDDQLPDLEDQSDTEVSSTSSATGDDELDLNMSRLRHWSDIIFGHVHLLQRHIEDALTSAFESAPSLPLYSTLLSMSHDPRTLEERLLSSLKTIATSCPDAYAVALEIYSLEHKVDQVVELLDSYSHLLRPRDAVALQAATTLISHHGHAQRALQILESELLDTIRVTRHALLQSFSQLETPQNRSELAQIIKMGSRAPGRHGRVESWVDAVTTPGADQPNPMMFAAMVMGIGPLPGMNPDDDPYTYLDLDPHDPDLEDLRSEYRPNLKKRFESWTDVALMLRDGPAVLLRVYRKVVEEMPFLRASDVTEEMIGRLQDRRSKSYVVDGLDALLAFVKVQRRKWNALKTEKAGASSSSSRPSASRPAASGSTHPSPAGPSWPSNMPASSSSSSTLNQPARPDSPGPPPLIPVSSLAQASHSSAPPVSAERPDSPGPPPLIPATPFESYPAQASTSQASAPPPPPPPPAPAQGFLGPLVAEIDAILATAPPAPPEGHTPLSLLNLLVGAGPAAPPAPAAPNSSVLDPPAHEPSIDDVD